MIAHNCDTAVQGFEDCFSEFYVLHVPDYYLTLVIFLRVARPLSFVFSRVRVVLSRRSEVLYVADCFHVGIEFLLSFFVFVRQLPYLRWKAMPTPPSTPSLAEASEIVLPE